MPAAASGEPSANFEICVVAYTSVCPRSTIIMMIASRMFMMPPAATTMIRCQTGRLPNACGSSLFSSSPSIAQ